MSSTTIPPLGRGVLATGKRVGRHFHAHVLGLAIIRDQLHDGDAMIESADGNAKVVRMRTELREPVPLTRPRLTRVEVAVALASQAETTVLQFVRPRTAVMPAVRTLHRESIEPSTARIILGIPFRRPR